MKVCDRCKQKLIKGGTMEFDGDSFDLCSECLEKTKNYIRQSGQKNVIDRLLNR